jgi:Zn-dependent peptidase ImmA (M78 family)
MSNSEKKRSWLKAIDEFASNHGVELPPFSELGMGTAIARDNVTGRSVSYKRRLVPAKEAERNGAEWSFWFRDDHQSQTIVTFREPLVPTEERIKIIFPMVKGWLVGHWSIQQIEKIAADTETSRTRKFTPDVVSSEEYWFSDDRSFGIVIEQGTWRIHSKGRCLTTWRSRNDKSSNDALPLISLDNLCLWIARNWYAIAFGSDVRPPLLRELGAAPSYAYQSAGLVCDVNSEAEIDSWWKRHAFRAAREDLPNVFIERQVDDLVVSWDALPADERFYGIPNGEEVLPASTAVPILRDLVQLRLKSMELEESERSRLLKATSSDAIEAYAALSRYLPWASETWLDQHGFSNDDARKFAIAGTTRHPIVGLLRTSQGTALTPKDYEQILHLLQVSGTKSFRRLLELSSGINPSINLREPWESGYRAAALIREKLGIPESSPIDIEDLITTLDVSIREVSLSDSNIMGACIGSPTYVPIIVVNTSSNDATGPSGRRITLAHELCHMLFDRSKMLSFTRFEGGGADSDRLIEMRANAFAVELLVPMSNLIKDGLIQSEEALAAISFKYEVSGTALKRHVQNLSTRLAKR